MKRLFFVFLLVMSITSIAYASPFDVVAKKGTEGNKVEKIQIMLTEMGFYRSSVDGVFGPGTDFAVKSFQEKIGVAKDGIVTENLYQVMQHYAKKVSSSIPSRYSRKLTMTATAYTTQDPGCGLYTARGNRLRKGLVAVDPKVIPLGTRLYIVGYGPAIADDTGGAIKGHKIDLAFDSRQAALQFGRRSVTVYILE